MKDIRANLKSFKLKLNVFYIWFGKYTLLDWKLFQDLKSTICMCVGGVLSQGS